MISSILRNVVVLSAVALSVSTVACIPVLDCLTGDSCDGDGRHGSGAGADAGANGDGTNGDPGAAALKCAPSGKPHIGLGGEDVAAKADGYSGDHMRIKPYSALVGEYTRVLGTKNHPALLDQTGSTFGQPNDRWYVEPLASAVLINTAFNVAFEACLKMTGDVAGGSADPEFAVDPTPQSSDAKCSDWSRRFWSREATPAEKNACVSALAPSTEVYGGGAIAPVSRETTTKRRWAYGCASVLSAAGFLTY